MDVATTVLVLLFISVKTMKGDFPVETPKKMEEYDPTGWSSTHIHGDQPLVDPTGWHYDRGTKSAFRDDGGGDMIGFCYSLLYNTNSENGHDELKDHVKANAQHHYNSNNNVAFVRRFINILLDSAGLTDKYNEDEDNVSGVIELKMTGKQYQTLIRFSKSLENISFGELDSVLSSSIERYESRMGDLLDKIFSVSQKEYWLLLIISAIALILMRMIASSKSFSGFIISLLLLIFIAGYLTEYYRMYKEVEIKQRILLEKHKNIPDSCLAENKFWLISFKDSLVGIFSSKNDDCAEYHKATLLDPLVEVSPVKVLSSILSDFVLHPASKLGTAISKFSSAILGELPVQYGVFVWMFSSLGLCFMACIYIIILLGGSLRLGNMFGSLSISNQQKSALAPPKPAPETTPSVTASPHPLMSTISASSNYFLVDANALKLMLSAGPSNRIEDLSIKPSQSEASTSNAVETRDLIAESFDDIKLEKEKKDAAEYLQIIDLGSLDRNQLNIVIEKCKTRLNDSSSESVINDKSQGIHLNETNPQGGKEKCENASVIKKISENMDTNEID